MKLYLNHSPLEFYFAKNHKNFIVEEIPLYEFSNKGEHIIFKIRKKNISTIEMIEKIAKAMNIKKGDIGYAGLKDKHALAMQYISINKNLTRGIESIIESINNIENLKILDSTHHNNKLKIGHLKGNKFFIRIKKLNKINAFKLKNICALVQEMGFPNYFGYQRFGINGNNYEEGRAILEGKLKIKDRKKSLFLISAYQSYLFNKWLENRVELSKIINDFSPALASRHLNLDLEYVKALKTQNHFFKILKGDVMSHYPYGKLFYFDGDFSRFSNKLISPTGLLQGVNTLRARDIAGIFEDKYRDDLLEINKINGDRRFAWIFPFNLDFKYKEEVAHGELNFTLPKGSYATTLLEVLSNRKMDNKIEVNDDIR